MIYTIIKWFKGCKATPKYLTKATLTATDKPEIMVLKGNELGTGRILSDVVRYLGSTEFSVEYLSIDDKRKYMLLTSNLELVPLEVEGDI